MLVISISKLPQNFTSEVSLLEVEEVAVQSMNFAFYFKPLLLGMVKVGASVYRI